MKKEHVDKIVEAVTAEIIKEYGSMRVPIDEPNISGYFITGLVKSALSGLELEQWIDVKERLPELEQDVLLFDDWEGSDKIRRQSMRVGYLTSFTTTKTTSGLYDNCEWRGHEFLFNITHWQPLPSPPKT